MVSAEWADITAKKNERAVIEHIIFIFSPHDEQLILLIWISAPSYAFHMKIQRGCQKTAHRSIADKLKN